MKLKSHSIPALLRRGVLLAALAITTVGCVSYSGKKAAQGGVNTSPAGAYFRNRAMDARDIFTVTAIVGAVGGAKAQLGPISLGLFAEIGHIGHGTRLVGEYGLLQGEVGKHKGDNITIIGGPLGDFELKAGSTRARDRNKPVNSNDKYPASAYTRLGVAGGACLGLRFEFNPGELVDFLLGLFGVDMYGDDVYKSAAKDAGK